MSINWASRKVKIIFIFVRKRNIEGLLKKIKDSPKRSKKSINSLNKTTRKISTIRYTTVEEGAKTGDELIWCGIDRNLETRRGFDKWAKGSS